MYAHTETAHVITHAPGLAITIENDQTGTPWLSVLWSALMGWSKIDQVKPPVGRPVLVRTLETDEPVIAFLSPEKIWYSGGALVQSSMTILGATPTEWCEPDGEAAL